MARQRPLGGRPRAGLRVRPEPGPGPGGGCADWLRTHADDLDSERRRPYFRVDTRAFVDEDRHTAFRGVLERMVCRPKALAEQGGRHLAFIMTSDLEVALAGDLPKKDSTV